jgi:hypothetical protein
MIRLPDLLCQGGSANWGLVIGRGLIPYIDGKDNAGAGLWDDLELTLR